MASAMPFVPSALKTGEPFFQSQKRKWIDDSAQAPPSGAWQLAPSSIPNGFAQGGEVYGEAVYSAQDRNLTSASAPVVSGLMCVAKDKQSTKLQAGDLVVVTNTSYDKTVHTLQKASLSNISGGVLAVVASYHHLALQPNIKNASSVSLICCGPVKLRTNDITKLVPGFYGKSFKLPGDTFRIADKNFVILTPVSKTTHEMRCMMDAYTN